MQLKSMQCIFELVYSLQRVIATHSVVCVLQIHKTRANNVSGPDCRLKIRIAVVHGMHGAGTGAPNHITIHCPLSVDMFAGVSGPKIQFDEFGDLIAGEKAYAWVKFDETSGQPVTQGYIDARRRKLLQLRL